MLPPEYLQVVANDAERLYEQLNQNITNDICRRNIKTGKVTDSAYWQLKQVQESGKLMDDIIADVAAATGKTEKEIRTMFKEAGVATLQYDAAHLAGTGVQTNLRLSQAMSQILDANIQRTQGDLRNLTMTSASAGQEQYIEAMNEAVMKVSSGAFSYQQALRQAVDKVAADGAEVLYSGGRMSLESAARMNLLTAVSQTAGAITERNAADMGAEYYEVSAHFGARPTHAEWQGGVYKIHGSEPDYPNFYDATEYGEVTGLCGVNCRHSFFPFFPGLSERAYTQKELDDRMNDRQYRYNGQRLNEYEASQRQRQLERRIRESKRKVGALEASIDECKDDELREELQKSLDQAKKTMKDRRARLTDFCNQTGMPKDYIRTRVPKPAEIRAFSLANGGKNGIINTMNNNERSMAGGSRKSVYHTLTQSEIDTIKGYASEIGVPHNVLRFNEGNTTGFNDISGVINVRGNIFQDETSSLLRDRLNERCVLAHEYYGHYKAHPSRFDIGDWRDEFAASYRAAIDTPNLTSMERRDLMLDAFDRAKEAGVSVTYNEIARRMIYGTGA